MTCDMLKNGLSLSYLLLCRPLPHPLYDFDGAEVCLIVKDHKGVQMMNTCWSI